MKKTMVTLVVIT